MDTDLEQDANRAHDAMIRDHRDGRHEPALEECPLCTEALDAGEADA